MKNGRITSFFKPVNHHENEGDDTASDLDDSDTLEQFEANTFVFVFEIFVFVLAYFCLKQFHITIQPLKQNNFLKD